MPYRYAWLLMTLSILGGCGFIPLYSYGNHESDHAGMAVPRQVENIYRLVSLRPMLSGDVPSGAAKASMVEVPWQLTAACRAGKPPSFKEPEPNECRDERFVALAISGGGSRAAVFSAAVMFELQRYGLLEHTDLVSCVSGGCLTAAYYALSCDDPQNAKTCPPTTNGAARYPWREQDVYPLMERDLLWRWIGNWFWPDNLFKFWLTHFDRTDIMAETLSNNLYDRSLFENNQFRFRDLSPARPNLAINATNVTAGSSRAFHFAFSPEQFAKIRSDLDSLPIANAVMASASFPGAFNYVTLRDFSQNDAARYIHLLDGGAYDNLGLNAIRTAMEAPGNRTAGQYMVIIIDAYLSIDAKLAKKPEPRGLTDYFVDSNFIVAYDTLLTSLRSTEIQYAGNLLKRANGTLLHISWEDLEHDPQHVDLAYRLNRIPTSFNISEEHANDLRSAAKILVAKELKGVLCDPARSSDRRVLTPMLASSAPPLTCE